MQRWISGVWRGEDYAKPRRAWTRISQIATPRGRGFSSIRVICVSAPGGLREMLLYAAARAGCTCGGRKEIMGISNRR